MPKGPICVEDVNLSHAWARAFLEFMPAGVSEIHPLVVTVTGFNAGLPQEDDRIRQLIDAKLHEVGRRSCHTVANTIFPLRTWETSNSRGQLYNRYAHMLPRLKSRRINAYGLYFERLISFGPEKVNQLEHIISTRLGGNRRRSALQAAVFDPRVDHTNQHRRGFPCLQQVTFCPIGTELSVTGFYATQYIFERAYGNYLGLCHLGRFVATELGLTLGRMTCITGIAQLDLAPKGMARQFGDQLHHILREQGV